MIFSKPKLVIAAIAGLGIAGGAPFLIRASGGGMATPMMAAAPSVPAQTAPAPVTTAPMAPAATPEPTPVNLAIGTSTAAPNPAAAAMPRRLPMPEPIPVSLPIGTPDPDLTGTALPHQMAAPVAPTLPMPAPARPERLAQADTPAIMTDQPLSPFGLPCGLTVTTEARPAAMVALDIMDPCQANARVVVEHSGLNLTGQTDVMGILTMDIPAFESPAFFTVRMPDGASASALAGLPDIADYDRVGVQWNEDRALELHAMEFGATYGDPGHIWRENAGSPARAVAGEGGFLTHLGTTAVEAPMLAEIYTFPRDTLNGDGTVRLTIETPVTETNCGQDILARTLESDVEGSVAVIELTFTVPGCDAVGDYLVLQNLLQDLRVAAN